MSEVLTWCDWGFSSMSPRPNLSADLNSLLDSQRKNQLTRSRRPWAESSSFQLIEWLKSYGPYVLKPSNSYILNPSFVHTALAVVLSCLEAAHVIILWPSFPHSCFAFDNGISRIFILPCPLYPHFGCPIKRLLQCTDTCKCWYLPMSFSSIVLYYTFRKSLL